MGAGLNRTENWVDKSSAQSLVKSSDSVSVISSNHSDLNPRSTSKKSHSQKGKSSDHSRARSRTQQTQTDRSELQSIPQQTQTDQTEFQSIPQQTQTESNPTRIQNKIPQSHFAHDPDQTYPGPPGQTQLPAQITQNLTRSGQPDHPSSSDSGSSTLTESTIRRRPNSLTHRNSSQSNHNSHDNQQSSHQTQQSNQHQTPPQGRGAEKPVGLACSHSVHRDPTPAQTPAQSDAVRPKTHVSRPQPPTYHDPKFQLPSPKPRSPPRQNVSTSRDQINVDSSQTSQAVGAGAASYAHTATRNSNSQLAGSSVQEERIESNGEDLLDEFPIVVGLSNGNTITPAVGKTSETSSFGRTMMTLCAATNSREFLKNNCLPEDQRSSGQHNVDFESVLRRFGRVTVQSGVDKH